MRAHTPLLCCALASMGCVATFAPPLRGAHGGAPGRLAPRQAELGLAVVGAGTGAVVTPPVIVAPALGVALSERVALEAGVNVAPAQPWTMVFLGARFTWRPRPTVEHGIAVDLEVGAGLGRGGQRSCFVPGGFPQVNCDGLRPLDRDAGGGYAGVGGAWRHRFLSAYLRARVEATAATSLPLTFWPSAVGGLEVQLWGAFRLSAAAGYAGYLNVHSRQHGWMYQLELSLPFAITSADGPRRGVN